MGGVAFSDTPCHTKRMGQRGLIVGVEVLIVTTVTTTIAVQISNETVMATNAERQAAWRARQKELGAKGRKWRIVDLTLAERDVLQKCLFLYRHQPDTTDSLLNMQISEMIPRED